MARELRFQVELVWNRESHWVPFGTPHETLSGAIDFAKVMENSGDGARVKKTRVLDEQGRVRWAHGKLVEQAPSQEPMGIGRYAGWPV